MLKGSLNADAITLRQIGAIDFAMTPDDDRHTLNLVGKAAFVNTESGATLGETTCIRWSEETLKALHELKRQMELDIGRLILVGGGDSGATEDDSPLMGIGEHLNDGAEAPSI